MIPIQQCLVLYVLLLEMVHHNCYCYTFMIIIYEVHDSYNQLHNRTLDLSHLVLLYILTILCSMRMFTPSYVHNQFYAHMILLPDAYHDLVSAIKPV